jgi:hypothetical protein
MSYDIFTGMLKMFPEFEPSSPKVALSYDFSDPKLMILSETYNLSILVGNGNDFDKAKKLLLWLSAHTLHKGDYDNHVPSCALDLLDYSFDKGTDGAVNCRALAIILTSLLLSAGIPARTIYIMPFSPYDGDNHVITHAYIKELKKWVMLDPTYSSYVSDENGNVLDILEVRKHLAEQMPIFFNEETNYNGESWANNNYLLEYLAKDLFWMRTSEKSTYDVDFDGNRSITLCPIRFDVKRHVIGNIEYRIRKYGETDWLQEWLENERENRYLFVSEEDFRAMPLTNPQFGGQLK